MQVVQVMASVAIRDAYLALVPRFAAARGCEVQTQWLPTVELMARLAREADEANPGPDLVLASSANIEALLAQGKLRAGSRVDVARSGIGVAVRAGADKPDLTSGETLKAALLSAESVMYSTGPSGVYLRGLFERMGIARQIAGKVREVQGVPVAELIARGEAQIGFQQVPEILPVRGIDYAGPLPAEVQSMTTFAMALHVDARAVELARAWVDFLCSAQAAVEIRRVGMEPVAAGAPG